MAQEEATMKFGKKTELLSGPERALAAIGRLLPRKNVKEIESLILSAGMRINGEVAAGIVIIIPIVMFLISAGVLTFLHFDISIIIVGAIGIPLIVLGIAYQLIMLRIDERKRYVESVLPDFLSLVAANIRGGMQLDKALWYAAKPEFGILSTEVELASKRVFSGESLESALDELAAHFNSRYLSRTVDLIKEGIVSGGEMASILERTSVDLRDLQLMHKEISASMVMYSIFIGFSAAIGAPILYVASHRVISMLERLWTQQPSLTPTLQMVRMQPSAPGISSADFSQFAIVFIIVTAIIATFMISVIQTGRKRNALKYMLPFLAISLATYYVGNKLLELLLGTVAL